MREGDERRSIPTPPLWVDVERVLGPQKQRKGGMRSWFAACWNQRASWAVETGMPRWEGRSAQVSWIQITSKEALCQAWTRVKTLAGVESPETLWEAMRRPLEGGG